MKLVGVRSIGHSPLVVCCGQSQTIHATGKVIHFKTLAAFPGTYTGARSRLTILNGKVNARLANGKRTIIFSPEKQLAYPRKTALTSSSLKSGNLPHKLSP